MSQSQAKMESRSGRDYILYHYSGKTNIRCQKGRVERLARPFFT